MRGFDPASLLGFSPTRPYGASERERPWLGLVTWLQNKINSITQRFLVPVSTVSARNAWHNGLLFVTPKTDQKFRGVLPEKLGGVCSTLPETLTLFQTKICDFPYPISDLIKNLIPYFRPEALEPGAWRERVTSCYGTYTVVGFNI